MLFHQLIELTYMCKVQLVEESAGTEGPSVILSRCSYPSGTVCLVSVAKIDLWNQNSMKTYYGLLWSLGTFPERLV